VPLSEGELVDWSASSLDNYATLAYVAPVCLETERMKCRGPFAAWQNALPFLETAVAIRITVPTNPIENRENRSAPQRGIKVS
jgi:hypothetical protein